MIIESPEIFYECEIKGKNKEELSELITELQADINDINNDADYKSLVFASKEEELELIQEHLNLARKEYQERFGVEK